MQARKDLGQYFTPLAVVALCYEMLAVLENRLANEQWHPRVLDPACGEGVFLRYALEHKVTYPDHLYGLDKDPRLLGQWQCTGLVQCGVHMTTGSALHYPDPASGIQLNSFDWVVGNPPYGGAAGTARISALTEELRQHKMAGAQQDRSSRLLEARFLHRFLDFARSGGHIAIIIPDGLLSNVRLAEFRRRLLAENCMEAIVSLPQGIFRGSGTSAKTSLVFLTKGCAQRHSPVFLAEIDGSLPNGASVVAEFRQFRQWRRGHSQESGVGSNRRAEVCIGTFGGMRGISAHKTHAAYVGLRSSVLPRFAWTLCPAHRQLPAQAARAGARLDPAYYNPVYDEAQRILGRYFETQPLGRYVSYTTYGQVGRREYVEGGENLDTEITPRLVRYLSPVNFACCRETGLVFGLQFKLREQFVASNSYNDPVRSRLQPGDLLLVNSGVACIGRPALFRGDKRPCTISQHINLLRLHSIQPAWLAVFLQTRYGRLQIKRECTGVGAAGINFARIKSLLIPVLSLALQEHISQRYESVQDHLAQPTPAAYNAAKGLLTELVRFVERLLEIGLILE